MKVEVTNFLIFEKMNNQVSIDEFVDYWSIQYEYPAKLYSSNINNVSFEISHLNELFEWKNGMALSELKKNSLNKKVVKKIEVINNLKINFNESIFYTEFGKVSAIWQIFLKHIIAPSEYPIFDMHVYRAFKYLQTEKKDVHLPYSDTEKLTIYEKEYRPFYLYLEKQMEKNKSKKLDEALWAFGKFLSTYPKMIS